MIMGNRNTEAAAAQLQCQAATEPIMANVVFTTGVKHSSAATKILSTKGSSVQASIPAVIAIMCEKPRMMYERVNRTFIVNYPLIK
ncbi:MAG: hypothetical protein D9N14_11915 [Ketobacter sp.]|nr:MAG: hypothetical protein D9N14_11915 [Ketobacter sp.]